MSTATASSSDPDADLLRIIKERWDYASREWDDIKKEGTTDIRFVAGDPWSAKDKQQRDNSGRPHLSLDELSQYVNQLINDVRQNKRAIKVTPMGEGANDASAKLQEALIRQIEYRSNAQIAYTTGFENSVQRSYGFWRIKAKYIADDSFDQELIIEPIPNPDTVTPDPDAQKPDGSDMRYCFVRESYAQEEFVRKFPNARITNFDGYRESAKQWVEGKRVWVAEYWTLETTTRRLLLLQTVEGPMKVFADELESKPSKGSILQERDVEDSKVCWYLTNGVEILEKNEWPGKWIPIVSCLGKVLYVDDGSGAKRRILSMIRLARDPFMYYCYIRTTQAEAVGKGLRTAAIGYEGQFRGHEDDWQRANHEPVAFVEARATTENTGSQVLPLPQPWPMVGPELSSLEVIAEGARRAIQAAIGQSPLPTSAQRRNEKSGIALRQIEETAQKGSYHFIDHYDDAITRTGQLLEDLIPHYYDTARDVTIRNEDDSAEVVRINDPQHPNGIDKDSGKPREIVDGLNDVTLSTGPSYESQREQNNEFIDGFMQQLPVIAQLSGPQAAAKLLSLAIKSKNLGAFGDEMAATIAPPEDEQQQIPPQIQQQMQQMGQQLQEAQQQLAIDGAKQQATIQKAQIDAQADVQKAEIDGNVRLQIAKIQADTAIATAQIKAGTEDAKVAVEHAEDTMGHEVELEKQSREFAHEDHMADKQHAQAVDESERGHEQALEQGEQGAIHAERQIERTAAVAPQPEA